MCSPSLGLSVKLALTAPLIGTNTAAYMHTPVAAPWSHNFELDTDGARRSIASASRVPRSLGIRRRRRPRWWRALVPRA
ncbi:hypothetical protein FA95DRAFT_1563808 [Auriscalpium vulgare]|uniref:Uncharacterized protein n=1 Tax=Auriscalpium vulgare TaxID=40419 RepID=A0ACB8RG01_9AGAM|nr:hypothetical protein FA95DRAFT_1563808 [Auriscalpium vulgare]